MPRAGLGPVYNDTHWTPNLWPLLTGGSYSKVVVCSGLTADKYFIFIVLYFLQPVGGSTILLLDGNISASWL